MDNDNTLFNYTEQGQILLTYELLFLLQWLMEHESESLKKMIVRSLKNGFNNPDFRSNEVVEMHISDPTIHQCIVDFLGLLDALLIESTSELDLQKNVDQSLMPALKHIDSSMCDNETVQNSLKKTNSRLHRTNENPQEILLKELLRRWKPAKKAMAN